MGVCGGSGSGGMMLIWMLKVHHPVHLQRVQFQVLPQGHRDQILNYNVSSEAGSDRGEDSDSDGSSVTVVGAAAPPPWPWRQQYML